MKSAIPGNMGCILTIVFLLYFSPTGDGALLGFTPPPQKNFKAESKNTIERLKATARPLIVARTYDKREFSKKRKYF